MHIVLFGLNIYVIEGDARISLVLRLEVLLEVPKSLEREEANWSLFKCGERNRGFF